MTRLSHVVFLIVGPTSANWLLQCSSCVDQAFFGDELVKENVADANLSVLVQQLKRLRLREFDHREDEFYNKFFSKRQLGILASEAKTVMPSAVASLPERRWTNSKGASNATKNVMLLRDSHLLMVALGVTQVLALKAEGWDHDLDKVRLEIVEILEAQNAARHQIEDVLQQIVRVVAKVELLQHVVSLAQESYVRVDLEMEKVRTTQKERHETVLQRLNNTERELDATGAQIAAFKDEFRSAVEREARADLVEKRKAVEAELEVQEVRREIEELRWSEEQKTVQMRENESRRSASLSTKLHEERVAHEIAQKKAADLEILHSQEASNMRQEATKQAAARELLQLSLLSEEKQAALKLTEAIETAKIEHEARIKERRDNEDVHLRAMRAEQQEKRQQTLAAIKATADIVFSWITMFYGSPQNLLLGLGSIVVALGGVYFLREMAILLREQLNKRLGKPALVRSTNRRGTLKQLYTGFLRLLRFRDSHGSEFNDVVLHPKLQQQVMRLAESTRSAKRRKMPLMHVMFYGPPGTGKTMVAQRFAEYSGLEYAIMSGGDVAPLQEQAVTELHKLFQWVHRSRRGVLLFIDEADAYLSSRKGHMSEAVRNALTTMLFHTGTPSSQFMLVLATNRPGDLDSAVLDRIDESVEFGLPDLESRKGMVRLYFEKYIARPLHLELLKPLPVAGADEEAEQNLTSRFGSKKKSTQDVELTVPRSTLVDDDALCEVAGSLRGFSGREISKLFISLQTHVLYCEKGSDASQYLERRILSEVVNQKVVEHSRTADFLASGYDYFHDEKVEQ
uniref:AAA+ ATPase domain-containing protein n=1 Tax=Noctiluca scintillans TaxID=2966 RepID=A0A7S1AZ88_NOCSC|mmetsp:Transcript_66351/g.175723  ORF Transcript_66351/g.175723 Transcript_66351/m.175723 type:complete len:798 (+) Transcript_66351:72-2465(+)